MSQRPLHQHNVRWQTADCSNSNKKWRGYKQKGINEYTDNGKRKKGPEEAEARAVAANGNGEWERRDWAEL